LKVKTVHSKEIKEAGGDAAGEKGVEILTKFLIDIDHLHNKPPFSICPTTRNRGWDFYYRSSIISLRS
jgi:hypothetical protein